MTFEKGQSGNPEGRPKGALNRTTRLKHAILDGIQLAADQAKMTSAEYMAEMMTTKDRLGVLRIGADQIPKEVKSENIERVIISMGPDEDCKQEGGDNAD